MTKQPMLQKLLRSERGDSMIEFAVVAIVLFMCIFGIMDCSRALYAYHLASYSAREATRYAMVRGSTWKTASCTTTSTFGCNATSANVQAYVKSIAPLAIDVSSLTVTTTWPGTELAGSATTCSIANGANSPGCLVMVQVSYAFNYTLPLLPSTTLNLKSTSEVVILR
jgi:Flp pilus assembly protein TadG